MKITPNEFKDAKSLASQWQESISKNREPEEKKFHEMMVNMLKDPLNKVFLIELLDQSFRSQNPERIAKQIEYVFEQYEDTSIFSDFEALLIALFRSVGMWFPRLSIPMFINYLRNDISRIVIKGESKALTDHLQMRRNEGTRVNINLIGEAVLGEKEARERIEKYKDALSNPNIDYISIKISTIFSQINPLAHEWSVEQLKARLSEIYQAAMKYPFTDTQGYTQAKFVNLDMEEYRDLHLTLDAFKTTLEQDEFKNFHAGIVLQTYLPDTLKELKSLAQWAKDRVHSGGAPIKVRLVKGANQEMELTEASLRHWECVTYLKKEYSDANYKICMDFLLDPEVAPYVHIGIASHNLFDHALANILASSRQVEQYYTAEMLEGMSETAYKLLKSKGINVILYAPIATAKTFTNAIAYLVRRFDENTADQNFLRYSFGLQMRSPEWEKLLQSYDKSIEAIPFTSQMPFRTQDRNQSPHPCTTKVEDYRFKNVADTDFSLSQNRVWAVKIRDKWQNISKEGGFHAMPVVDGKPLPKKSPLRVIDKSQYHQEITVGSYTNADASDLLKAVEVAALDPDGWREKSLSQRQEILMQVGVELERRRGDLIGVAAAEVGKVFTETDVEVSEAIDFCNFYPYSVRQINSYTGIHTRGKGVGLVVSPWNFPVAIPTGGVAASLAAGNTVLIKPASNAVLCAYMMCECFWAAGVSKRTLQFIPTPGKLAGEILIPNKKIDFVIFTGGEQTAYDMLKVKPDLHLSAETGGKDATIVTSLADRDQAIKNVVASAFNNSGQKCSATSLLILEKELYEDNAFMNNLVDVASSLEVGSVWDFKNRIGALSDLPQGNLNKALHHLDPKERWALQPSYADRDNPYMLRPSIRYGTQAGDFCHMHELFGPVLSVMKADSLDEGIELVNATGYGLTSGIESLDRREQEFWKERLKAGNLYINRMTTGAIVLRQPFGGMGKSAIGSGRKAGGLNYVAQFMDIGSTGALLLKSAKHIQVDRLAALLDGERFFTQTLNDAIRIASHFASFLYDEFLQEHDYVNVRGESNVIRYLPMKSVLLRLEESDDLVEMLVSISAIKMSGAKLILSLPSLLSNEHSLWLYDKASMLLDAQDEVYTEDLGQMLEHIPRVERLRFLNKSTCSPSVYAHARQHGVHIATESFISHGRIELMHYFYEQSVSNSYHRYGNLGRKGLSYKENT